MTNNNIPKHRPPGSGYAKAYGATNPDGTPAKNLPPVRKAQRAVSPRDGLSPNEVAAGRREPDAGRRATSQAIALLYGPSIAGLERVAKTAAKTKLPPGARVVDGNGTLLGIVGADGTYVEVVQATAPTAPAAKTAPTSAPAMGEPGSNPPRTGPMPAGVTEDQAASEGVKVAKSLGLRQHNMQYVSKSGKTLNRVHLIALGVRSLTGKR